MRMEIRLSWKFSKTRKEKNKVLSCKVYISVNGQRKYSWPFKVHGIFEQVIKGFSK